MKTFDHAIRELLTRSLPLLATAVLVLSCALTTLSQMVGRPDRGFKAGNSYSVSEIENVTSRAGVWE
jgi:hypothetical protein